MKVLLVGGYGGVGVQLADILTRETDSELVIAGRHLCRAEDAVARLTGDLGPGRLSTAAVDASDRNSLLDAAAGADLVIVCAQTGPFRTGMAETLLAAGVDCIEINADSHEDWAAAGADDMCKRSGRTVITEAGIFPGLPSLLTAQAAGRFDDLEEMIVGHLMQLEHWERPEIENFLADMELKTGLYSDGAWRDVSWKVYRPIDFGGDFGLHASYPYILPELLDLPERFGIESLGLYAAGLGHWTLDWLLLLNTLTGCGRRVRCRRLMAGLMRFLHRRFSRPPYGTRVKGEAVGLIGTERWKLETFIGHPDVYRFTAAATAALVTQWLDGSARRPGLWMMGQVADPARLLDDMQRFGIEVASKLARIQNG